MSLLHSKSSICGPAHTTAPAKQTQAQDPRADTLSEGLQNTKTKVFPARCVGAQQQNNHQYQHQHPPITTPLPPPIPRAPTAHASSVSPRQPVSPLAYLSSVQGGYGSPHSRLERGNSAEVSPPPTHTLSLMGHPRQPGSPARSPDSDPRTSPSAFPPLVPGPAPSPCCAGGSAPAEAACPLARPAPRLCPGPPGWRT